jgi:hypothetical protein
MGVVAQALSAIASALRMRDVTEPARTRPDPDEPPVLLVKAKVRDVLRRGVPVNRIEAGPSYHTARAVFADGSIAVVRSIPEGHLMAAAVACLRTRVTARPATGDSEGDIVFAWRGGHVLVELMGPDQPD